MKTIRKHGKRYSAAAKAVDVDQLYDPGEAVRRLKQMPKAKFDETVDCAIRLGVDPKQAEQQVRGTVGLPAGTGKSVRVLVFAKGEKAKEAETAGADFVGAEDFVEKIQGGWVDFDVAVATPDVMNMVGRLGRVLGPRGLMPNPKAGTVTFDIAKAVREIKAGKIEYRTDKFGIIHAGIGKASFTEEQLLENLNTLIDAVLRAKPASAKGQYLKTITLSTTMGPAVKVDPVKVLAGAKVGV